MYRGYFNPNFKSNSVSNQLFGLAQMGSTIAPLNFVSKPQNANNVEVLQQMFAQYN
jgi:hypothetical protein